LVRAIALAALLSTNRDFARGSLIPATSSARAIGAGRFVVSQILPLRLLYLDQLVVEYLGVQISEMS
jgi:hypothetical protein